MPFTPLLSRRRFLQAASAAVPAMTLRPAAAQAPYPDRPITLVVPQPVGGDADAVCRLIQKAMQAHLGQSVIIDNRPGAAGNIGVSYGLKAPADGHTVTFVNQGIVAFNPVIYANTGFSITQMMPVSWLTTTDLVFCARPGLAASLPEFLALAREHPERFTYGSAGNGSANHIATKLLESTARVALTHVPYKGGAPALIDTLAGVVDTLMAFPLAALPHIKAGKLIALATTGAKRSTALPDVPTVAESGVTGYEFSSWFGFVVPAGTPGDVIERLNAAATYALRQADTAEKLRAGLTEPVGSTPQEFAQLITRETAKWTPLLKQYLVNID